VKATAEMFGPKEEVQEARLIWVPVITMSV